MPLIKVTISNIITNFFANINANLGLFNFRFLCLLSEKYLPGGHSTQKECISEERIFYEYLRVGAVLGSVFQHRQRVDRYSGH